MKDKKNKKIKNLGLAAMLAALTTVMTAFVCHIPLPGNGGYIHLGDSLIYLSAALLPTPYAMAVGAIGGGLADLLTAPIWVLPTIIVKMLIVLPFTSKGKKIVNKRNIIATVIGYVITALGYYFAECLLFDESVAFIMSVFGNFFQSLGSAVAFIAVGIALDKMDIKRKV